MTYAMKAEWEPQQAVILSAPLNQDTWIQNRQEMERDYATFAAEISKFQPVWINCVTQQQEHWMELLNDAGAIESNVVIKNIPTNDAWCRDHGPITIKHDDKRLIVNFKYNAWGGKYPPWDLDDEVPTIYAKELNLPRRDVDLVCEGGALETNGEGTLLTTKSVLLNPNRNPKKSQKDIENILMNSLGVQQILWLDQGMETDDTDGHIDTLARFASKNTVLAIYDKHNPTLVKNLNDLKAMRLLDGSRLEVVKLPCPKAIETPGWRVDTLPASYANFLIINDAILVPTYRQDETDKLALDIIAQAFPTRQAIPIDCYNIVLEGGALHCLSQQVVA